MRGHRLAALWLLAAAGCGGGSPPVLLRDLDGAPHCPQTVAAGEVHVLVFTSQECPIANSYAPTLRELAAGWRGQPVHLFVVHVDPDLTAEAASEHARQYDLPGTILIDPEHRLATAFGVTRTPEAVVLTTAGLGYRGRIDDQWQALGARTDAASTHDLRDAVAAVRAGRAVPRPWPAAVGCLLPEPAH